MTMRSWLFVPGDSERKLAKAVISGADAVIIDLEDAVAPAAKAQARMHALGWLQMQRNSVLHKKKQGRWVRINGLETPYWREDLVTVMQGAPDGIVVPKALGPLQMQTLSAEIYEHEQRHGLKNGDIKIIPFAGETAASALTIPEYLGASMPRLAGLTWGAEDLTVALGASRKRDENGGWSDVMRYVRAQLLLTAHARNIAALDAVYIDFQDLDGLKKIAQASAADGFTGMLAIHPDQVAIINEAFMPTASQLSQARRIVAAFRENPDAGALAMDGRLIETPHLERAKQILELEETPPVLNRPLG